MFDTSKGALSIDAAASVLGKSMEETRRMMYKGDLQGILAHNGKWWILQESVERYLGYPINICITPSEVE
jgi:predicted site-specific integrase-resolvase